ncbi:CubicO group peptidase (beta-lactamase class C family) [Agromyces flavus]|nr:serine hydrolase domain-containing protein [Agromyces flavus]MCP2366691.1 CubicO group peptidase (beta-lactamase class C family) [Agromyces flavus]GGI45182.1 serine hydrolase [Agromyces flavus]
MRAMRVRRPAGVIAATMAVAVMAGCSAGAPQAEEAGASTRYSGDEELLQVIRPSFSGPDDIAAVALVADGEVRTAFVRADAETRFEIGSITKTFTGLLLAEAIERGEVALDDPLGIHLDLDDAPVADVTLGALATHQSGLPIFPSDPEWQQEAAALDAEGKDAVDETLDELLALARAEQLPNDPTTAYSNFGAALAGQALAAAAGTEYRDILAERILEPLGLEDTSLPIEDDDHVKGLAQGFTGDRRKADPSTLGAFAPAGGIVTTVEDLARYAQGVIDGPYAGSAALEPNPFGDGDYGYFWALSSRGDRDLVSHDGMTTGFTSALLIDRTAGTAAIVFVNRSSRPVHEVARDLLGQVD